ncbi:MAG: class I adenylate-forming enzyme family protein [Gammaproteobacteria bacterium]
MSALKAIIEEIVAIDPAANAVEFLGQWHRWGELGAAIRAIDQALADAGLGPDARVGAVLRNCYEAAVAIVAIPCTDRCMVVLNPSLPDERLADDVARIAVPAIVAAPVDWAREPFRRAALDSGALCLEVRSDPAAPVCVLQALEPGRAARMRMRAPGDALELLTSGTTGPPKRIPLPVGNFETSMLGALGFESRRADQGRPQLRSGVQILSMPFGHVAGLQAVIIAVLAGRQSCILERFSVPAIRDALVRHRPRVFTAPPAALRTLFDANLPKEDLSSLAAVRTGTAALDPDFAEAFYERYGIPILQNYGATEFPGVAGWTPEDFRNLHRVKRGSVGRLNTGIQARVVSQDTGDPVPAGQAGLLELRAAHIGDGRNWVRTSDLAVLDEDGFLWIRGRADAAIVRGGFKVHPEDVARAIEQHPAVHEAVVVGLADARLGAVPAAAFTTRPGMASPTDAELTEFLRARLLAYQIPVRFAAIADLPRNDTLKISLVGVKALFE